MYTKDGFHKALEQKLGDDAYLLLANGGHKKLTELLTAASLTADGNNTKLSITVGGTTKTGSVTVPYASAAAKWATARKLTIGATGKNVDGSAAVSWSIGEIVGSTAIGTTTNPIYWTGSAFAKTTYLLSATVNAGAANRMAYYSGANAISQASSIYASTTAITINGTAAPANSGNFQVVGTSTMRHIYPESNNSYNLGSSSLIWKYTYTRIINSALTGGTNTAGSDGGSSASPNRYKPMKWTFNSGITPANGDIVTIKTPGAGHDYGVFLSTNNGTNYYPITLSGTGRLTTHFPTGSYLTLLFDSSNSAASMYALAGADSRSTVSGGTWRVINYYDSGNPGDWNLRQYTIKAAAAINGVHIIGGTDAGYKNIDAGNAFDIRYPILYAGSDIASGSTGSNNYIHHYAVNFRNSSNSNISGLTSYKNVYIKGTISGTTFTPISGGNPYTQTITESDDGYAYYYIGRAYGGNAITFDGTGKDIYVYHNGKIQRYVGSSGSATLLQNKGTSTGTAAVTITSSSWSMQKTRSGYTNLEIVWGQAWNKKGQTYTPSGGSATSSTDTGNIVMYLSKNDTSNDQAINIQIDGLFYAAGGFYGNLTGNASTATKLATARTINGTSFDGSANIITTNWGTSRTLTIGATGKSVNGSANVSWSLDEIGVYSKTASNDRYVYKSGDTMTGTLTMKTNGTDNYNQGIRINRTATNKWALLLIGKSGDATTGTGTSTAGDGAWLIGTPASSNSLIFNLNDASESKGLCLKGHGNNDIKWNNNNIIHAGNYTDYTVTKTGSGASGTWGISISGNAATATKWKTARTLTIGATGKTVDGSANVTWTLAEIGASASTHYHRLYTTKKPTSANWYRVLDITTYGTSILVSIGESYNNGNPTSSTFIVNVGYTTATIKQIDIASRTPNNIDKIRVVRYANGKHYIDVHYKNTNTSGNNEYINFTNLGHQSYTSGIALIDWTSQPASDALVSGETLDSEESVSTDFIATKLKNARTITIGATGRSFDGTANISWTIANIFGTSAIGGTAKPIYYNGTNFVAISATVGASNKPVFLSSGTITASSSTIGNSTTGVYLSSGTITAMSYSLSATVNAGAANRMAYYSGANAISQASSIYASTTAITINGTAAPANSGNFQVVGTSTMRHIYPEENNKYDLGSTSLRWKSILYQGSAIMKMDSDTSNAKVPLAVANTSNTVVGDIGYHNTGDTNGAFVITPYEHSGTNFWGGAIGLYIGKNNLKWENKYILRYSAAATTGKVIISDGTVGNVKTSSYSIGATVNAGTANTLAYYSGANAISSGTNLQSNGSYIHIINDADIGGGAADTSAPFTIGTLTSQHIAIDNNEILSKSNATTPSTLFLQDSSGIVQVNGTGGLKVWDINIATGATTDAAKRTISSTSTLYLNSAASTSLIFQKAGAEMARFNTDSHFVPSANATRDLGTGALRWRTLYLSNYIYVGPTSYTAWNSSANGVWINTTDVGIHRTSAGGGFYVHANGTQQARLYLATLGTANSGDGNATRGAQGEVYLYLGNNVARPAAGTAGGANNSRGRIIIYGTGTGGTTIMDGSWSGNHLTVVTGTNSTAGSTTESIVIVGNSNKKSAAAGSSTGRIRLYGEEANYHDIYPGAPDGNRTHYLPNATGWIATGGNGTSTGVGNATQPVYLSTNGLLVACTAYANASVNYATTAGSASSVAWANVASKPATATRWPTWSEVTSKPGSTGSVNQPVYWNGSTFVACTAYSSASVSYASTAGTASSAGSVAWGNVTSKPSSTGSATQPVYWNGSTFVGCSYTISAKVNAGTANRIAYYSGANAISSGTVTTDGAYLGAVSYLSVNNAHQTSYRLYVNGTSYHNGTIVSAVTNPFTFYGSGTGTYTQSVIYVDTTGFTIETPRATNSSSGNILPLYVRTRGGQDAPIYAAGGTMTGRIVRAAGGEWIKGRDHAVIFGSSYGQQAGWSWNTVWSQKTTNGAWTAGNLSGDNYLMFVYDTDADYNSNNNNVTYTIKFPLKSGTVALTSDIGSGGTVSGDYLPLAGGTMTGTINLRSNAYSGPSGTYGMNCNNSDIVNVNSIYTADLSDGWDEGILFKRTNGNWDSFRAADGNFYFSSNNNGTTLATLNNDGLYLNGTNGWIRTYGSCGWYSQTYGGGWYMNDSNFIKTYNGKILHMNVNNNSYGACGHHLAADFYNPEHICIGLRNSTCSWYICSHSNTNMYIGYRPNGTVSGYSSDSYPVYITNGGSVYSNSDRKLKKNISFISKSELNDLFDNSDLLFRKFTWKSDNTDSYGFIAQELEEFIPEAVSEDIKGIKHVSYNVAYAKIIASLVQKIKELENENGSLKLKIEDLYKLITK